MKKKNTFKIALGCLLFLGPFSASAYETSIHFYLTYLDAYWCGLKDDAYTIALADYSVDKVHGTDAGAHFNEWLDLKKENTRRIFHFAVPKQGDQKVVRGSEAAWETVKAAITNSTPAHPHEVLLGMGLHTLQDSYAHEGFGPRFGHWTQTPDLPESNPDKMVEAAEATYQAMNDWAISTYGRGCAESFANLAPQLKSWAELPLHNDDDLADQWEIAVNSITHLEIEPENPNHNEPFLQEFLLAEKFTRHLKQ